MSTCLHGLRDLALCLDLGRFFGNPVDGSVMGGRGLRLGIDEPWVRPILTVRGLRSFDLGITVKCDLYAKRVMEDDLKRDAVVLRDDLRDIMCAASPCRLSAWMVGCEELYMLLEKRRQERTVWPRLTAA